MSHSPIGQVRELYELCLAVLQETEDPIVELFAADLPATPSVATRQTGRSMPQVAIPSSQASDPSWCQKLVSAFAENMSRLRWGESYTAAELGGASPLGGWVPLASPSGPLMIEDGLVSVFVLNPNRRYPRHRHRPGELYVALAGGFRWEADGNRAVWIPPGSCAHNLPNQPHALESFDAPAAVLSVWRGGSYEKSEILESSQNP